jgi:porin
MFRMLSIVVGVLSLMATSLNAQDIGGANGDPVFEHFGDMLPIDSPVATPDSDPAIGGNGLFGRRRSLAERGILLDLNVTQFYQGVTSGGLEQRFRYGGHGDYLAKFDFDKLLGREGLFLQLRAEHRFGQAVNLDSGSFGAPAVLPNLPVLGREDVHLTNFVITQALSEKFIVFAGKVDTLDGDFNDFAHGRGRTQFFNSNFVFNPIAVRTIPYSTLAAGFSFLQGVNPIFTFTVLNATDTSTTSGFDELFDEGVALSAELRLPTQLFGRPGHFGMGGTWNSREYISLGQDPRILEPDVPIALTTGSWSLRWNVDHYLFVDPCDPSRGWGFFGRAGISDGNPNPIKWIASFGFGGNSPLPGRGEDRFGLGWYYGAASSELGPFFNPDSGNGGEFFYNIAVTPNIQITPDLQIINGGIPNSDTAVLFGLRANLAF